MTRAEYIDVGKLTDEQLEALTVVNLAAMQLMVEERNKAGTDLIAVREQAMADLAAKEKDKADALKAAQDKAVADLAVKDAAIAAEAARVAEAQAIIAATIGDTEAGRAILKAKRIAELEAAKVKVDEELAILKV